MSGELEARKRRLVWRAGHRGMRELDLVLGGFARREADGMDEGSLQAFEALLEAADCDLYEWLVGMSPAPQPYEGALLSAIRAYRPAPLEDKA